MNKVFTIILILFSLLISGVVFSQDNDLFSQANKFYEEKDYDSAIRMYQSILNNGVESAAVYFNMANAYFKKGDLGYAVFNYMKARRLDPADEDIKHNLEFARQFSRVQMEGVELNPINSFMSTIVDSYHLNDLAWVSTLFFVIFMVVLIFRFGLGIYNSFVKAGLVLSLILLLVLSGLTTYKYRTDYLTKRGVIIYDDVSVYTGPSEQSDIELEAAPGLMIVILDENATFYNVLFENKRRGWVKKDLIAII